MISLIGKKSRLLSLYMLLPLAAYPLFVCRLIGKCPFWGDVECVGLSALGFLAVATLCFCRRDLVELVRKPQMTILLASTLLCLLATTARQFIYVQVAETTAVAAFYLLTPLVALVFYDGNFRTIQFSALVLSIILLPFTFTTPHFSGAVGNWNWNFALLTAVLPMAMNFVIKKTKLALIIAGVVLLLVLGWVSLSRPELTPRGVWLGIFATPLILLGGAVVKEKYQHGALWIGSIAIAVLIVVGAYFGIPLSSRGCLWRGACSLFVENPLLGVGAGRFGLEIAPHLPPAYFFSDFPATLHPHPHNELFNYAVMFGISGVLFFLSFVIAVIAALWRQIRNHAEIFPIGWAFLLLLIHGCFDMTLSTPLAGTVFLLSGGYILAVDLKSSADGDKRFELTGIIGKIFGWFFSIMGVIFGVAAIAVSVFSCVASNNYRNGKLALTRGAVEETLVCWQKSATIWRKPENLYQLARLSLELKNLDEADKYIEELKKIGAIRYFHAAGVAGEIAYVRKDYRRALEYLLIELEDFPFSAEYSALAYLSARELKLDDIAEHLMIRYKLNMQLRNLAPNDFNRLRELELEDSRLDAQKLTR